MVPIWCEQSPEFRAIIHMHAHARTQAGTGMHTRTETRHQRQAVLVADLPSLEAQNHSGYLPPSPPTWVHFASTPPPVSTHHQHPFSHHLSSRLCPSLLPGLPLHFIFHPSHMQITHHFTLLPFDKTASTKLHLPPTPPHKKAAFPCWGSGPTDAMHTSQDSVSWP